MKSLFLTVAAFLVLNVNDSMAGQCPNIKGAYYRSEEFRQALTSSIEIQTGFQIRSLKLKSPGSAGDSHSGLFPSFVPSGLSKRTEPAYGGSLDKSFSNRPGHHSLEIQGEQGELTADFRFDDWTLCQQGRLVQSWIKIDGWVRDSEKLRNVFFIWDFRKQMAIGPAAGESLLSCDMVGEDSPQPFYWGAQMTVHATSEHGKYFVNFGFDEKGSFSLLDCQLTSSTTLSCEGEGVHSATISWFGLIPGRPDQVEIIVMGRNATDTREVLIPRSQYRCGEGLSRK